MKLMEENLSDEQLTEEGHRLYITVRRYATHTLYINRVAAPDGAEILHVRSWEILPMMMTMAHIYRTFGKTFELEVLEEIVEEMKEAWKNERGIEPAWRL